MVACVEDFIHEYSFLSQVLDVRPESSESDLWFCMQVGVLLLEFLRRVTTAVHAIFGGLVMEFKR